MAVAFRLRFLFDPAYIAARFREIDSPREFARRAANLAVYARDRAKNAVFESRGVFARFCGRIRLAVASRNTLRRLAPPAGFYEPKHLDAFLTSRLSLEAVRNKLRLAASFQKAAPFKHVVIDGFLLPKLAEGLSAEFPRYDAEKFKNSLGHPGKAHHEKITRLGPAYRELDKLVSSPEFLDFIGGIAGIPRLVHDPDYYGGGVHENIDGMEMDPHVDFTLHPSGLHRRVNLLLYLNPEWQESWGGVLELHTNPWEAPEHNPIKKISPLFNRCVIFETGDSSWHGFEIVRPPVGRDVTRRSFALYFYTTDDPRGILAIPPVFTTFANRPLPDDFKPGMTLTADDVQRLKLILARRDRKLQNLYAMAISVFNDLRR